jgi:spermidine/putrescine-binding protein
MKKFFSILLVVFALGAVLASCTPQKQACAAYSTVELDDSSEK